MARFDLRPRRHERQTGQTVGLTTRSSRKLARRPVKWAGANAKTSNRGNLQTVAAIKPEAYIGLKGIVPCQKPKTAKNAPCLHCMMVELIDEFFAENPASADEPDVIDTDEVITAVAKTVAELTSGQDGVGRQQIIENLMREIMEFDAEEFAGGIGSAARH